MKEEKKFLIPAAEIIYFEDDDIDCITPSGQDEISGMPYDDVP